MGATMKKMNMRRAALLGLSLAVLLTGGAAAASYKLGPADRVGVKVQEWPNLSGDYSVNPDGALSLPMIGDVPAAGREPADLAREISDRLQQRSPGSERPVVGVEIVTFRPFFILGDVERPGEYPYRPGLTVLEAIGVAGGFYRPVDGGPLRLRRDAAVAQGDIDTFSQKLLRQKARLARLQAAIAGSGEIAFPPELTKAKDSPVIASILAGETSSLALERETAAQQVKALESVKLLYKNEIDDLNGQVDALKREQDAVKQQLVDLRALSGKGLALTSTVLTLERAVAQSSTEQLNIETAIVQAQEYIAAAAEHVRELALARSSDDRKALEDTKDAIKELNTRVDTSEALLDEAQTATPRQLREQNDNGPDAPPVVLVRHDVAGGSHEIVADDSTTVEPGDVIKVPERNRQRSNPLDALLSH